MRHQVASSTLLSCIWATIHVWSSHAFLLEQNNCQATSVGRSLPPTSSGSQLNQAHSEVTDYRDGIRSGGDKDDVRATAVVMKFGGSSLAGASRVDHVANLIKDQIQVGYRPRAVVCSAMGKTTNALLAAGDYALGTHCTTLYGE